MDRTFFPTKLNVETCFYINSTELQSDWLYWLNFHWKPGLFTFKTNVYCISNSVEYKRDTSTSCHTTQLQRYTSWIHYYSIILRQTQRNTPNDLEIHTWRHNNEQAKRRICNNSRIGSYQCVWLSHDLWFRVINHKLSVGVVSRVLRINNNMPHLCKCETLNRRNGAICTYLILINKDAGWWSRRYKSCWVSAMLLFPIPKHIEFITWSICLNIERPLLQMVISAIVM